MTSRYTADTITDDALDLLYADLARYEEVVGELNEANTTLARQAARADAAIARVRALHQPQPDGSGFPDGLHCRTCSEDGDDGYQYLVRFPCPTAAALGEPGPITGPDGRVICTCTHATPCGCGTSAHYRPPLDEQSGPAAAEATELTICREHDGPCFPDPEARCPAHGDRACALCHRNPSTCADPDILECGRWITTGMHWDTCSNRIRGPLAAPAHDEGPSIRECADADRAHWDDKYAGEGQ
ncbi:hypothetical protein RB200_19625 [Streptomyces sp. PmtG]